MKSLNMEMLNTIQTNEKLNNVYKVGDKGPGGAHHTYRIHDKDDNCILDIQFQKGARKDPSSTIGILDVDLLEIVRDRLTEFQQGEYANEYNELTLQLVILALKTLNRRVEDRINRNVLGTYEK